jgi:hypothetical protein
MIRYGVIDAYLFHLGKTDKEPGDTALALAISRPYDFEQLANDVTTKLQDAVTAENTY